MLKVIKHFFRNDFSGKYISHIQWLLSLSQHWFASEVGKNVSILIMSSFSLSLPFNVFLLFNDRRLIWFRLFSTDLCDSLTPIHQVWRQILLAEAYALHWLDAICNHWSEKEVVCIWQWRYFCMDLAGAKFLIWRVYL